MIEQKLTVVMYHYVRDLRNSRFPEIKGLDAALFEQQIEYLRRNYTPVTMEQVLEANRQNGQPLPKKAVLLTFDDGYADHFTTVFPILYNRGLQGSFFAPVKAITEHIVLDVNKIHFILASTPETKILLRQIKALIEKYRDQYSLLSFEEYYEKLAQPSRYDTKEVILIKRLLQVELPIEVRTKITDELFTQTVGIEQSAFSRELYMSKEQINTMIKCGMHVGSHGYDHFWLGSLTAEQQEQEIKRSVDFIGSIGGNTDNWTICYPYGDYNETTLSLLKKYNCQAGFTTEVRIAQIGQDNIFTLPRLDTNDIPKIATADKNEWWTKG